MRDEEDGGQPSLDRFFPLEAKTIAFLAAPRRRNQQLHRIGEGIFGQPIGDLILNASDADRSTKLGGALRYDLAQRAAHIVLESVTEMTVRGFEVALIVHPQGVR